MVYVVAQLRAPELLRAWRKIRLNFFEKHHFFENFENLILEIGSEAGTHPNRFCDSTLTGTRLI